MRMLLTARMDTALASKAIKDNRLPEIMKSALDRLQPEAVYFGAQDGDRTAYIVFDLKDPSGIPPVCEPLFAELGVKVHLTPVMSLEDLQSGMARLAAG